MPGTGDGAVNATSFVPPRPTELYRQQDKMTLTQAEKRFLVDRAKADPDYFWESVLGCTSVYDKQLQMARAVRDHNRVAVVGANGTGKDWQSARLMLWWMATRYPAICVVLGPTHRQVSDIVWKEARSAYLTARMGLGGQMYRTCLLYTSPSPRD